jgi:hypothetical protein
MLLLESQASTVIVCDPRETFLRFHVVLIEVFAEVARSLPSTYTAIFTALELALAAIVVRDPVSVAPDEGLVIMTVGTVDELLLIVPDGEDVVLVLVLVPDRQVYGEIVSCEDPPG